MPSKLYLCKTLEMAGKPYKFSITGIGVYSFEEALYHCLHYFKESADDFTSPEFIAWVCGELGLLNLKTKLENIRKEKLFSKRLIEFLSLAEYITEAELERVRTAASEWENRLEWEKLKERGDYLMNHNEFTKAFVFYKKALEYAENTELLNNTAISLMKQGRYDEAVILFTAALEKAPDDERIMLCLAEAHTLNKNADEARTILARCQESAEVYYFLGELDIQASAYTSAIANYAKAIELSDDLIRDVDFIYRLADVYVKLRQFNKALEVISNVQEKDKYHMKKNAELLEKSGNIPAAIKCVEKALVYNSDSVDLWIRLAVYHRMSYDLNRAYSAIIKALNLSPKSEKAMLEHARIKKAMGKTKDYQQILKSLLDGFKESFRETEAGVM